MGAFTKTFTPTADCIVTESYIYSPVELHTSKDVKRVKIARTLWDTGASCSLVSERIAKMAMACESDEYDAIFGQT